ncbi:MAG: O-antigen ligase family protein [Oscillospiraceae bacterium]|nr:O-antigen ligase family protein [Oscillospiraceae bacterium]
MENKLIERIRDVYFIAVAVMMYYFLTEYIDLGLYVTYRHAFALLLAVSAILLFLYKPNIARGFTAFKSAFVYSIPLAVTTMVSLFIWFVNTVDTEVISRGLSASFVYTNMLSFALAAGALLYVFGERGIWYNLIAILIANVLMILTIIAEHGLANYFSELIALIKTFAEETGEIIVQAEVHELAFCIGAYLIFMLFRPKKSAVYYVLLALSFFCFLSAFKRIAMVAIAIALALGYLLKIVKRFNDKSARTLALVFSFVLIAFLIGYVAIIKMDAFELLEEAGISTSGRDKIYNSVDEFYEFTPGFLGNGIGFLTYQLNTFMNIGVASIHNDFLQHYIDLGFWGYIIWLTSLIVTRIWYFGKNGKTDSMIVSFMLTVYLVIVSSTDNTMNYPLLTGVLAVLMMGCGFDDAVRTAETKMFGCISDANKEKGNDSLL